MSHKKAKALRQVNRDPLGEFRQILKERYPNVGCSDCPFRNNLGREGNLRFSGSVFRAISENLSVQCHDAIKDLQGRIIERKPNEKVCSAFELLSSTIEREPIKR